MNLCLLLRAAHLRFLGVFYPDKAIEELEDRRIWLWVKKQLYAD